MQSDKESKANAKPTAVVTGGSSGIGLSLAKLFARDGYSLVIVSHSEQELASCAALFSNAFPDTDVRTICADLSIQDAAAGVYEQVNSARSKVAVLVNCAGFSTYGRVWSTSLEREVDMINLNVMAVYQLTRLFLVDMLEQDEGYVLNVASSAGTVPIPEIATYAATKAFVLHFTDALNYELHTDGSSVSVTALCPPPVPTGFQKAAGMESSGIFDSAIAMDADLRLVCKACEGVLRGVLESLMSLSLSWHKSRNAQIVSG